MQPWLRGANLYLHCFSELVLLFTEPTCSNFSDNSRFASPHSQVTSSRAKTAEPLGRARGVPPALSRAAGAPPGGPSPGRGPAPGFGRRRPSRPRAPAGRASCSGEAAARRRRRRPRVRGAGTASPAGRASAPPGGPPAAAPIAGLAPARRRRPAHRGVPSVPRRRLRAAGAEAAP